MARTAAKALTFIEIGRLCAHVTDLNHGASFLLSPRKTTLLNDACHHGDANAVRCEHLHDRHLNLTAGFEAPCIVLIISYDVNGYPKLKTR